MDELLDKINRKGIESLTPREKEMLEEASRKLNESRNRYTRDADEDDD